MVSLMNEETLPGTVAAFKTLDNSNQSWEKVALSLIEEQSSQKMCTDTGTKAAAVPIRAAAAVKERKNYEKYRCHSRSQLGNTARHCKAMAFTKNG